MQTDKGSVSEPEQPTRAEERQTFLFLAVLLAPIMTFALVGGYGFIIWMSQLLLGPPSQ